jgi:hypothetical protein
VEAPGLTKTAEISNLTEADQVAGVLGQRQQLLAQQLAVWLTKVTQVATELTRQTEQRKVAEEEAELAQLEP